VLSDAPLTESIPAELPRIPLGVSALKVTDFIRPVLFFKTPSASIILVEEPVFKAVCDSQAKKGPVKGLCVDLSFVRIGGENKPSANSSSYRDGALCVRFERRPASEPDPFAAIFVVQTVSLFDSADSLATARIIDLMMGFFDSVRSCWQMHDA